MDNMTTTWSGFQQELPPVIGIELMDRGWRGVTEDGEILDVTSQAGMPAGSIVQIRNGQPEGYREIFAKTVSVTDYENAFNLAVQLHRDNRNSDALEKIDSALSIAPTMRARFNRSMILLALGRWPEGFAEFEYCERASPFIRPNARAALDAGGVPWEGEPLVNRRLLVQHDHGFGDTIMMLRFVETLQTMCEGLVLSVPKELKPIAGQFGDVLLNEPCDYFTSFLHLMHWMNITPDKIPTAPYVKVGKRARIYPRHRRKIGVAWSVGSEDKNDFPRSVTLQSIIERFSGAEFHSVQKQGMDKAEALGVFTHDFYDFADVAELMMDMDEVVSVDTAAVHLAGAIGHPNVTVLLSKWHSWRWRGNLFYPNIRIAESGR